MKKTQTFEKNVKQNLQIIEKKSHKKWQTSKTSYKLKKEVTKTSKWVKKCHKFVKKVTKSDKLV